MVVLTSLILRRENSLWYFVAKYRDPCEIPQNGIISGRVNFSDPIGQPEGRLESLGDFVGT